MNNEKLREEIRQVVQACPFGPLTELLNRCYVALGERPAHDVASVPAGYVMVPVEMLETIYTRLQDHLDERAPTMVALRLLLQDALAASPSAQAAPDAIEQAKLELEIQQ